MRAFQLLRQGPFLKATKGELRLPKGEEAAQRGRSSPKGYLPLPLPLPQRGGSEKGKKRVAEAEPFLIQLK